ncbi:hypothetical protein [uncultured Legionella sp.]|uniref:hypothetical protein n=1 Tax=uncultured Legionella sp. TaxID=210934 RepID=UPI0026328621|nr:hypothetical protein [uncultured Legionella sp.]
MYEYRYKNFLINYEINFSDELKVYLATGEAKYSDCTQEFSTLDYSLKGVKKEIKKLIEQYVDFEWEQARLLNDKVHVPH